MTLTNASPLDHPGHVVLDVFFQTNNLFLCTASATAHESLLAGGESILDSWSYPQRESPSLVTRHCICIDDVYNSSFFVYAEAES